MLYFGDNSAAPFVAQTGYSSMRRARPCRLCAGCLGTHSGSPARPESVDCWTIGCTNRRSSKKPKMVKVDSLSSREGELETLEDVGGSEYVGQRRVHPSPRLWMARAAQGYSNKVIDRAYGEGGGGSFIAGQKPKLEGGSAPEEAGSTGAES